MYVFAADKKQYYRLQRDKWIDVNSDVVEVIKNKYGVDNVRIIES